MNKDFHRRERRGPPRLFAFLPTVKHNQFYITIRNDTMKELSIFATLFAVVICVTSVTSRATLLAYEGFEYGDGILTG